MNQFDYLIVGGWQFESYFCIFECQSYSWLCGDLIIVLLWVQVLVVIVDVGGDKVSYVCFLLMVSGDNDVLGQVQLIFEGLMLCFQVIGLFMKVSVVVLLKLQVQ